MPKIAINQDNSVVFYLDKYNPNKYIDYKMVVDLTDEQLLLLLNLSNEELKVVVDELLLSLTNPDEH